MADAFVLGQLMQKMQSISISAGADSAAAAASAVVGILTEAASVVGRPAGSVLSKAELLGVYGEILNIESQVGVVTRVKGFFTFVNTIWFMAIVGIAASIGPSLYHVLKPIRAWIKRALERLYTEVIVPVVSRLHRWGVIEFAVFAVCWLQVASGYRLLQTGHQHRGGGGSNSDMAEMVALTGSMLVLPAFAYSSTLWIQPARPVEPLSNRESAREH